MKYQRPGSKACRGTKDLLFCYLCVYIFLSACIYIKCVSDAGARRGCWELELETVMNCHAGDHTHWAILHYLTRLKLYLNTCV